ncbi:MAG: FxLYD domain-containing protein [Candidatus Nitrosopolaris sp.]
MTTNNHKKKTEFSVSLIFCIVIVVLMASGSTATTMVYASHHSSGKGSSGKSRLGSSTPPSDVNSGSSGSGSSGSGNSTGDGSGNTGGESGGTQGSSSGSGSKGGGGTEGNNNNPGPSSNQGSTPHCDSPSYPSCSSLGIEAGKNAPGTICPPGHSKAFCGAYEAAAGSFTNNKNSPHNGSSSNNNVPLSSSQEEAAHCDQRGWPSCYSVGFQDGKNHAGATCLPGHSTNFCSGWNAGARNGAGSYIPPAPEYPPSSCPTGLIGSHCSPTTITGVRGLGTIREVAPGAPAGPHTFEYIQAFNTAAGNPYKPGTKQYQSYQAGLDDAKKAGRDCDKIDTCGGPDLLGNYVNGVLHLNDEQYCGNGFGVYSSKLCKFRAGCITNSLGTVTCPPPQPPLPRNCHYILGKLICSPPPSISSTCHPAFLGLRCLPSDLAPFCHFGFSHLSCIRPGDYRGQGDHTKVIHETEIKVIQVPSSVPYDGPTQIVLFPPTSRDFMNSDPNTISLDHVTITSSGMQGWIKGMVSNNSNQTMHDLRITGAWYDSGNNTIGMSSGYADGLNLNPGQNSTFSQFSNYNNDTTPSSVELSYDWQ